MEIQYHFSKMYCFYAQKTTNYKVDNFEKIDLNSKLDRYTYGKGGSFSKVESHSNNIELVLESFEGRHHISDKLSCLSIGPIIYRYYCSASVQQYGKEEKVLRRHVMYIMHSQRQIFDVTESRKVDQDEGIAMKTAINTLDATTHQCIRSTGIIEKRFKTDKAQIQYKKLSCWYVKFYVDYIKVGVK